MNMQIMSYKFYDKLKQLHFIDQIWLFGSRARKDNQKRADIDLAILCPRADFYDWVTVQNIIDNADTLLKIDCVRLDTLNDNSDIKKSIEQQGIKLYERI